MWPTFGAVAPVGDTQTNCNPIFKPAVLTPRSWLKA